MTFIQKLETCISKNNSLLSIGLDPDPEKLPPSITNNEDPFFAFNKAIIDATHDLVCAYKPQIAEYSAYGIQGLQSLLRTISYLRENHPTIPLILDAKRGDIGSTSEKYAREAFDVLQSDAVTVNPYFGLDSLEPFLKRSDKGVIILCRTSNKSASDFQDLMLDGTPLYLHVAQKATEWNNTFKNCLLVVGATWPEEMKKIREHAKDMYFLVPGIGAQGGDLGKILKTGLRPDRSGLIIHSSRAILFASNGDDFAERAKNEAKKMRDAINQFRV